MQKVTICNFFFFCFQGGIIFLTFYFIDISYIMYRNSKYGEMTDTFKKRKDKWGNLSKVDIVIKLSKIKFKTHVILNLLRILMIFHSSFYKTFKTSFL